MHYKIVPLPWKASFILLILSDSSSLTYSLCSINSTYCTQWKMVEYFYAQGTLKPAENRIFIRVTENRGIKKRTRLIGFHLSLKRKYRRNFFKFEYLAEFWSCRDPLLPSTTPLIYEKCNIHSWFLSALSSSLQFRFSFLHYFSVGFSSFPTDSGCCNGYKRGVHSSKGGKKRTDQKEASFQFD